MPQLQRLVIDSEQLQASQIALTREQQHYLNRVLRLQTGDRFIAMHGKGQWWLAELAQDAMVSDQTASRGGAKQTAIAHLIKPLNITTELPVPVTLMAAPAKGSTFEQVVRCTTELGVTCLVPLLSDRTVLQPSSQKYQRWRRIAAEAAEQSRRQVVPDILEPMVFSTALQWAETQNVGSERLAEETPHLATARYICVTDAAPGLLGQVPHDQSIMLMTGPEGGWTPVEQGQAVDAGYQPVSLGQRTLRAATAPIAALSVITAVLEQDNRPEYVKEPHCGSRH